MIENKFSKLVQNVKPSGIAAFFEIASSLEDVVSLAIGEPDFDTPWHIREAAIHAISRGNTFYTPNGGFKELKEAVCNYLYRRFNVTYKPEENVIITVGCSEAIDLTMRVLLDPEDEVIVPSPGYAAYEPCVLACGGKVVALPLVEENRFKLTAEKLEAMITPKTKLLILNFPSNPTGGIMTKEDYEKIVPVIKKHGIMVLADEIYGELTYVGKHYSIASFEEIKDQVILMNGVSKAYSMTGWRIGFICAHKDVIKMMGRIHDNAILCAPTISQYAAIEALNNGDKVSEEMKVSFEQRRNYIVSECNRIGLPCFMPEGAFYVFANITSTGLSSEEFASRLINEAKVVVVPGTAFGDYGEGFIRISYSYSIEEIKEAIIRMEEFLRKLS